MTRKPIQIPDSTVAHFITFSCYQQRRLFRTPDQYRIFLNDFESARKKQDFKVFAYVIMPSHVHMFAQFHDGISPSKALRGLKRISSYHLLESYKQHFPGVYPYLVTHEGGRNSRRFWQAGIGYDQHQTGDDDALREIIEYIHGNPVRAGLTGAPEEWEWSSARDWLGKQTGLVGISSPWAE